MGESLSDIRMAENEVVFRQANERVAESIRETKAMAKAEGQHAAVRELDTMTLLFSCECMYDTCRERIALTPKAYERAHRNKSRFVLVPGHNNPKIERIMQQTDTYLVVQKFFTSPEKAAKLRPV